MIELVGCIGIIFVVIMNTLMVIDELRTNHKIRKDYENNND